jgi:hypothetical protein
MITLERFFPYYVIAGSILVIANVVWAFTDARRRGRSGILVSLMVLWTFPIGVILWLMFRPSIVENHSDEAVADLDAKLKERANAGLL